MHITKLELKNIKSYEEAFFEFERGTTAIVGENGAGKTTLIEAIAWVMFDMLDYKKDDFLRRGAKTGTASVEFESGLDERRYIVERDTRTSYYVYDPRSKTRIAEKKEEVTRFIWQHFGVEPGTDLESLFRRAIGVPQGTFTSIFLEPPSERKKAFEKLLKVEEYRLGAARLGMTSKHIDTLSNENNQRIARSEGILTKSGELNSEKEVLEKSTAEKATKISTIEKSVGLKETEVTSLDKFRIGFEKASGDVGSLMTKETALTKLLTKSKAALEEAENASKNVESERTTFEKHKSVLEKLKALEKDRVRKQELDSALNAKEKDNVRLESDIKSTADQIKRLDEKKAEVQKLEPLKLEQESLERRRSDLEKKLSNIDRDRKRIDAIEKDLEMLRKRYKDNLDELKKLAKLQPLAESVPKLRSEEQRLTTEAEKLRARLESDREFREEIKDGMCPIFAERCKNLPEGETLDGFLVNKFDTIESKVRELQKSASQSRAQLEKAIKARDSFAGVQLLEKRKTETKLDGENLKNELTLLTKNVESADVLREEFKDVESTLRQLDNPAAKLKLLAKDIASADNLERKLKDMNSSLEASRKESAAIETELRKFREVEAERAALLKERDETDAGYRMFLQNQAAAAKLESARNEHKENRSELEKVSADLISRSKELTDLKKSFDPELFAKASEELRNLRSDLISLQSDARNANDRLKKVEAELAELKATEKELKSLRKEKERLEKLGESVKFIRNTLQQAAPQVARNYVYHVSVEANRFFREISGDAESTLRWTDDYAIELEEQGFNRPFVSLSGGEKMSAALAVRLSLLRQLSDVRIAFFDEPTANMDIERRERLAEQISRITENQTFDQLFVISHDDTFENYVDHVIEIGS